MGIDLGFRKQQFAEHWITGSVIQHEANPGCRGRDLIQVAVGKRAAKPVHLGHRLGEVCVDRIKLLDRREIGFVLDDKGAFTDKCSANHAIDGSADGSVIQVEPCAGNVGLAGRDVCFGLTQASDRLLMLGFRDHLLTREQRRSLLLMRSQFERGSRLCQRRFARPQFDFERPLINSIKRIAGLYFGALVEHPLNHNARYAGPNIGNARGSDTAGQFANQGTGMRFHGNDAHFGFDLCRGLRSPRLIATGKKRRKADQQQSSARHAASDAPFEPPVLPRCAKQSDRIRSLQAGLSSLDQIGSRNCPASLPRIALEMTSALSAGRPDRNFLTFRTSSSF